MKFRLIDKVMMCAVGQAGRGDNDASHLTYLLAYTGLPSAILWLIYNHSILLSFIVGISQLSVHQPPFYHLVFAEAAEASLLPWKNEYFIRSRCEWLLSMTVFDRGPRCTAGFLTGARLYWESSYTASLQGSQSVIGLRDDGLKMNTPLHHILLFLMFSVCRCLSEWACDGNVTHRLKKEPRISGIQTLGCNDGFREIWIKYDRFY